MKVLRMTLIRKWFDQIASGEKTEEYREFKEYWFNRIVGKEYDVIHFRNGYSKDVPEMLVEYKGAYLKTITWNDGDTEEVIAIKLGKILEIKNYKNVENSSKKCQEDTKILDQKIIRHHSRLKDSQIIQAANR